MNVEVGSPQLPTIARDGGASVKGRRSLRIGGVIVAVAAAAAALLGVGREPKRESFDPTMVVTVKRADLELAVDEMGKIQPRERVEIKSKVAGQVEKVLVTEGERVRKAQLLLYLDPTDYRREVERATAELRQAEDGLEFAQLTLRRRQGGLASRATALIDVESAEADVRGKTVGVTLARVALAAAQDKLRYTRITSPMDGVVIEKGIQPGEVVTPGVQATFEGKALLTIADLSSLRVSADLNQIDAAKVKIGDEAVVTLDALPGHTYRARINKTAPASIIPKGKDLDAFPVEATLEVSDPLVKPGMTADLKIRLQVLRQVLVVPVEALLTREMMSDVADVWVLSRAEPHGRSALERRSVELGARNDQLAEVRSGLSQGDSLLIRPDVELDSPRGRRR